MDNSAGEEFRYDYSNVERGLTLRRYWTMACQACPIKDRCTSGPQRRIIRWEHEDVLEAVQRRLDETPQAMRQRRETVDYPFGTIRIRMGVTHFLMKRLPKVASGDGATRARLQSDPGAEHPGHQAADGCPQGIGAGLRACHQASDMPNTRFRGDWSLIPSTISQFALTDDFETLWSRWEPRSRLLPKSFDTTKTRFGHSWISSPFDTTFDNVPDLIPTSVVVRKADLHLIRCTLHLDPELTLAVPT